jgi:hypothetical protein
MQPIVTNVAALTVAALYYMWRAHHQRAQQRRERKLRERVAYMLWVMADRVHSSDSGLTNSCRS